MRRIAVLSNAVADSLDDQARLAVFRTSLEQLGWSDGRNVRIDYRWSAGEPERIRRNVAELVALAPDVVLCSGGTVAIATLQAAVMREAGTAPGGGQFAGIQSVAPSLGVELSPVGVGDVGEMERAVTAFARSPNAGLIVTGSGPATTHRDLIVTLAARHKLPAVYFVRLFVTAGGLISYGPDYLDLSRRTAGYVDRILKGEKPADLPVQAPTKYELFINLNTARALGLEVPPTLLARADEVIE
jgi:putative tryptophan/tyrosine transport system substrate-binding protein